MEEGLLEEGSYVYGSYYQPYLSINDSEDGFGGAELSGNILVGGIAFLSSSNPSLTLENGVGIFDKKRSGVITYEVQQGDTLSYIAASFGISTNTVLWANNLNTWSTIKPGNMLIILPDSGVLHEIKKGETLASIVKQYKGDIDETLAYNGLPADASVKVGQKIVIPGGQKAVVSPPRTRLAYSTVLGQFGDKSHQFPWGQCTWYVAQKRYIPWGGNAKTWLSSAKAYGFPTGTEPVPGAIMATSETWYGHVAFVEAVNGDKIVVSEMSLGRGKLGLRVFNINDRRIKGYIY